MKTKQSDFVEQFTVPRECRRGESHSEIGTKRTRLVSTSGPESFGERAEQRKPARRRRRANGPAGTRDRATAKRNREAPAIGRHRSGRAAGIAENLDGDPATPSGGSTTPGRASPFSGTDERGFRPRLQRARPVAAGRAEPAVAGTGQGPGRAAEKTPAPHTPENPALGGQSHDDVDPLATVSPADRLDVRARLVRLAVRRAAVSLPAPRLAAGRLRRRGRPGTPATTGNGCGRPSATTRFPPASGPPTWSS